MSLLDNMNNIKKVIIKKHVENFQWIIDWVWILIRNIRPI